MRSFNSKRTASTEDNAPKQLTVLSNNGYHFHAEDPENKHVPKAAENAANHYLYGCHHACGTDEACNGGKRPCRSRCSDKCGGSFQEQNAGVINERGIREPSPDAQELLGIEKNKNGKWGYNPDLSAVKNYPTLGDYLNIEVTNKHYPDLKALKVSDYAWNPKREIGFDSRGNKMLAGNYIGTDHTGKTKTYYGEPMHVMGVLQGLRDEGYKQLTDKGSTNIGDYFEVAKRVNAYAHGIVQHTDKGKEYRYLEEGQKPVNFHNLANGVIGNIMDHTEAKHPALKDLHEKGKSTFFVMCHCPRCAFDQTLHPSNSVFDMQDHNKAANSQDPAVRQAYYAAFPMGASKHLGEGVEGRVSQLGDIGKRTPHRQLWISKDGSTYLHHVVNGRKDEKHELYTGNDVAIPMNTPPLNLEALSETTGRNPKFWENESSSNEVTPVNPGQPSVVRQRPISESAAEAQSMKERLLNEKRNQ